MSDAFFSNVSSLLHFDGADGSTTFADVKGVSWTAHGNAQIDTAQSKFGGASGYFDGTSETSSIGTGSRISAPSGPSISGTGDFTIEFGMRASAYATGGSGARIIFDQRPGTGNYPAIWTDGTNVKKLTYFVNSARVIIGTTTLVENTWYHVALCRASGTTRLFLNGNIEGSFSDSTNYIANGLVIGGRNEGNLGGFEYQGWIDDFRITNGIARYTANFTPPTAAFPSAGTPTTRAYSFVS